MGADHTGAEVDPDGAADGAQIYVILENLLASQMAMIRCWAARNKIRLYFTAHQRLAANPIGAQLVPLCGFVIGGSDHPNHSVLAGRLQGYLGWTQCQRAT